MRIAVIYDGDGRLREALEAAGHDCVGFDPNPRGFKVGSGRVVPLNPRVIDFSSYDMLVVNRPKVPKWVDHDCAIASTAASAANDVAAAQSADSRRGEPEARDRYIPSDRRDETNVGEIKRPTDVDVHVCDGPDQGRGSESLPASVPCPEDSFA